MWKEVHVREVGDEWKCGGALVNMEGGTLSREFIVELGISDDMIRVLRQVVYS